MNYLSANPKLKATVKNSRRYIFKNSEMKSIQKEIRNIAASSSKLLLKFHVFKV